MPSDDAVGRDAFLSNWSKLGKVYACPPPKDVAAVLKKFVRDKAEGGLLVPQWFSLYGWNLLCEDGVHLNRLVSSVRIAWPFLTKGPQVRSEVFSGFTKFPFLSMKIKGHVAKILINLHPDVYKDYTVYENGVLTLYVEILKALYGLIEAPLLWYQCLKLDQIKDEFVVNPYNPCVTNKMVDGKQLTVT